MRSNKTTMTIAAAIARVSALACGAAMATGEGTGGGTDRSNKPNAAVICRAGANAVARPQADGRIVWTCVPTKPAEM